MKPLRMFGCAVLVLFGGIALAAPEETDEDAGEVILETEEKAGEKKKVRVQVGTSVAVESSGDWASLPPERKREILERLKKELPPEALREALRALAGKSNGARRAPAAGDVLIEVNGKPVRAGKGKDVNRLKVKLTELPEWRELPEEVKKRILESLGREIRIPRPIRVGEHAVRLAGVLPRLQVPPAPPTPRARGHETGLLDAIRALTREISSLRDEVRALREARSPDRIMIPGHPHPLPRIELEIEKESAKPEVIEEEEIVILEPGKVRSCIGPMTLVPEGKAPGRDLEKEMETLKKDMDELKARMAKILESIEKLAAEKR
ncbi:MAG: hypothetical protein ACYS99_04370 [Planctomycetota bacterium]|jgi:prefoldin subunit 5